MANEKVLVAINEDKTFAAFVEVVAKHPQGVDAGPKLLLEALKAKDAAFADLSVMKVKKMQQLLRSAKAEAVVDAKAEATTQKKQAAKRFTKCPKGHELNRYIAEHEGYACDNCHKKPGRDMCVPIGSAMWGCRVCNWDICEEKCFAATPQKAPLSKVQHLEDAIAGLQAKLDRCIAVSPDQEKLEKILKLITKEVIKMEENTDVIEIDDWVKGGEFTKQEAIEKKAQFLSELSSFHLKIQKAIDDGPRMKLADEDVSSPCAASDVACPIPVPSVVEVA